MKTPSYYVDPTVTRESVSPSKGVVSITHSLMLDFQDGTKVIVPPPSGVGTSQGSWVQLCGKAYNWAHPYVTGASQRCVQIDNAFRCEYYDLNVRHEAGELVLKEYCERLHHDPARVLAWIRWVKEEEK